MRTMLLILVCLVMLGLAMRASAVLNSNAFWQLHLAGPHDPQANTCDLLVVDAFDLTTSTASISGRYDIYVLAMDVWAIRSSRFGLVCDGEVMFYGWTSCADSDDPSSGWPGCDEGITLSWAAEQVGPHVTMGILDTYVYGAPSRICTSADPRVGYAECCDGSVPTPRCDTQTNLCYFGCVGFGRLGYLATECGMIPVAPNTWGAVKALYR